ACWRWHPSCRTAARQCCLRRCAAANAAMGRLRRRRMDQAPDCADTRCRGRASVLALCSCCASHRLDEHGTALPAAAALGGDAALQAKALHCVDQVQDNAVAAGADRMTGTNRAAVNIETVARNAASRRIETERVPAKLGIFPRGKATQHLRGEGFVEFPQL